MPVAYCLSLSQLSLCCADTTSRQLLQLVQVTSCCDNGDVNHSTRWPNECLPEHSGSLGAQVASAESVSFLYDDRHRHRLEKHSSLDWHARIASTTWPSLAPSGESSIRLQRICRHRSFEFSLQCSRDARGAQILSTLSRSSMSLLLAVDCQTRELNPISTWIVFRAASAIGLHCGELSSH
jgi:hypothetical protein